MSIYVDGVMAINFVVDYLLLLAANRLSGFPPEKKRLAAASLLGTVYSGICLLPEFRFLGNLMWRTICLGLMGSMAFGWNPGTLRRCGIFVLLSLALGGLAVCIGRTDIRVLALSGLGLWCLCRLAADGSGFTRNYLPLEIRWKDRTVKLLALRDTGNTLRDPITGQQALVLSSASASQLTGLTPQQISHPLETMASGKIPGLRLLPYRTVGQGSGMMLAMVFEDVVLDGRKQKSLVAFAPENFGREAGYQALTGGLLY